MEKVKEQKKQTDKSLEELIEERESLYKNIDKLIEKNKKVFTKNYSNKGKMEIPIELFFKMGNHISMMSQQLNILHASTEEFMIKLKRAVVSSDMLTIALRKKILEQIEKSAINGDLKEIKSDKEEEKKV